jgi:hypothetical protein
LCDVYWEVKVVWGGWTNNIPENPSKEDLRLYRNYLTDDFYRHEDQDGISLIDFNKRVLYRLLPSNNTYFKKPLKENIESTEDRLSPMGDQPKVTYTKETKVIAGFKCKKYLIQMMGVKIEHWVSDEVPGYALIKKKLGGIMKLVAELDPMLKQENPSSVSAPKGIIVHTVKNIMGTMNATTITRIEERDLDAGLFIVPSDYRELPWPD